METYEDEFQVNLLEIARSAKEIADALDRNLTSPNETDRNMEPANVVDGLFAIARGLQSVARVIDSDNPQQ